MSKTIGHFRALPDQGRTALARSLTALAVADALDQYIFVQRGVPATAVSRKQLAGLSLGSGHAHMVAVSGGYHAT